MFKRLIVAVLASISFSVLAQPEPEKLPDNFDGCTVGVEAVCLTSTNGGHKVVNLDNDPMISTLQAFPEEVIGETFFLVVSPRESYVHDVYTPLKGDFKPHLEAEFSFSLGDMIKVVKYLPEWNVFSSDFNSDVDSIYNACLSEGLLNSKKCFSAEFRSFYYSTVLGKGVFIVEYLGRKEYRHITKTDDFKETSDKLTRYVFVKANDLYRLYKRYNDEVFNQKRKYDVLSGYLAEEKARLDAIKAAQSSKEAKN